MQAVSWHFEHTCKVVYNFIHYTLASKEHHIRIIDISEEDAIVSVSKNARSFVWFVGHPSIGASISQSGS